ncbi:MAG: Methylated-DNA--protein-cysteine methyltransferase [Firmicutes bacterium]|nr:Methylated-DNA--protein-cysteine methyltransferase [Bacillota bacterium]
MQVFVGQLETALGAVHYAVSLRGAMAITVPGGTRDELLRILGQRGVREADCLPDEDGVHGVKNELSAYFDGVLHKFDLPLDVEGTDFQLRVWQALREIPYGETWSYMDIARTVGLPKAARAVGQANKRNPLPLVIPCHRVCAHDGSLGGFAGGLDCKRALLDLEQRGLG